MALDPASLYRWPGLDVSLKAGFLKNVAVAELIVVWTLGGSVLVFIAPPAAASGTVGAPKRPPASGAFRLGRCVRISSIKCAKPRSPGCNVCFASIFIELPARMLSNVLYARDVS
ncbi:hypothetical protein QCE63_17935 [Caballeronia sp. LZ065]|uniref:hypothetical protein n=1 Tax=Caballeronia sp. LZ065 TaxID=3038571 RepID=UPI002863BCA2|nr:hypothetical protein [Caballeronia sp. LZ065]MDR5781284.1 hypothetical protein [Caballeronia sp. LZ065]